MRALRRIPELRTGLNVCHGQVTCRAVAEALGMPFAPTLIAERL